MLRSLSIAAVLIASTTIHAATLTETQMLYTPPIKTDIVLSNGFTPHRGFQGTGYRLEPLHRNHSPMDYKAWHDESWADLTVIYGPAWQWPREMTEAQNASDLETKHYAYFLNQTWVSYTVMNPEGTRVLGSLYITPGKCGKYGAYAQYWITTPERANIEATFVQETREWLNTVWPYEGGTYYPGLEVSDADRAQLYVKLNSNICE